MTRPGLAIVAALVVIAAAGYWWINRTPGRYKPDNSGLYPINVNGKYGFMDRSGKVVITPQFDHTIGFSEGLASVEVGTKWGYINTKGVVVITPQFAFAHWFRYGRAHVRLGDRFGFIDKDGKYISSPNFREAGDFSGDLAPVMTADGSWAFVRRSGEVVLSGKFEATWEFNEGLARAASAGKWGFIDPTGKWVVDPQFERAGGFANGLAPVTVGGRTGYIDQKGKFVVNPQYDSGDEFSDGYARFGTGGKFGFIDTKGRVVSDAKFLAAGYFSDGLAPVKTEDGWGIIDRTGKMVVSPQFDTAEVFQNGLARVTALGKEAYITTTGAFVVDPFPGTNVRAERARNFSVGTKKVAIGAKDEVRYSGTATEAEAKALGDSLKSQGYLADKGVTVVLAKGSDGTAVGFVVQEGAWDNDDNYAIFEHMVRLAASTVGGFPIKLLYMNSKLEVKKDAVVHPYITVGANDQIGYSGTATEQDAKALIESLKSIGYLKDRGTTVLLSKGAGGTVVSFVVMDGAWDDESLVASYKKIGGSVAPSVGGAPIKVRMMNTLLRKQKEMPIG